MVPLRIPIECSRCKNTVDKALTRAIEGKKKEFECFDCFRSARGQERQQKIKRDLYCQKCNYKFSSKRYICPYCNMIDFVMEGNVSVQDLL